MAGKEEEAPSGSWMAGGVELRTSIGEARVGVSVLIRLELVLLW